jgi:hypothetical protein
MIHYQGQNDNIHNQFLLGGGGGNACFKQRPPTCSHLPNDENTVSATYHVSQRVFMASGYQISACVFVCVFVCVFFFKVNGWYSNC